MSRDEDDMGYPMPLTQPEIRDKARKRLTGAAVLIWGAVAAAVLGVDAGRRSGCDRGTLHHGHPVDPLRGHAVTRPRRRRYNHRRLDRSPAEGRIVESIRAALATMHATYSGVPVTVLSEHPDDASLPPMITALRSMAMDRVGANHGPEYERAKAMIIEALRPLAPEARVRVIDRIIAEYDHEKAELNGKIGGLEAKLRETRAELADLDVQIANQP